MMYRKWAVNLAATVRKSLNNRQKPFNMNEVDNEAFISLFRECFQKCFGHPLTGPMSETETRHLGNTIFEATGLVIGAKSLKNYSLYIATPDSSKPENPSVATLDTMARYVLAAPYTDEIKRKEKEGHYPYWYQYKGSAKRQETVPETKNPLKKRWLILLAGILLLSVLAFFIFKTSAEKKRLTFTDNFHLLQDNDLTAHGWMLLAKDSVWWNKREMRPGMLSLFTLTGDNWPDTTHAPVIKNLLIRKIAGECFSTEIHFTDFIPTTNWQQAGLLLMEDTVPGSKTLRLSIGYNDFFGGFQRPKEIILQGVSTGGGDAGRPEEIVHFPLFSIAEDQEALVNNNLRYSALRIETKNGHYRFLYSAGPVANFAFKEAFAKELDIQPKYIGLFALQGFVSNTNYMPVNISYFNMAMTGCHP